MYIYIYIYIFICLCACVRYCCFIHISTFCVAMRLHVFAHVCLIGLCFVLLFKARFLVEKGDIKRHQAAASGNEPTPCAALKRVLEWLSLA